MRATRGPSARHAHRRLRDPRFPRGRWDGRSVRARDIKLERDVALKVLPPAFTDDVDRVTRFTREARLLASLNHPHIGTIYGFEDGGHVPRWCSSWWTVRRWTIA